jgi:hypothetical protein
MSKNVCLSAAILLCSTLHAATLSPALKANTLVVYNSNMGLVHEERFVTLKKGKQTLYYPDVASTVETDSVNVVFPSGVKLYSQKYKYDKITPQKLLLAHVDKEVEVRVYRSKEEFELKKATLLSVEGRVLLRLDNGKIIQASAEDIVFNSIPETLITKSSLVWDVTSSKQVEGTLGIDYIINSIHWKSDYVLKINKDKADLGGLITLTNNSGKAFEDVSLKVLAGDVSRDYGKRVQREQVYAAKAARLDESGDVREVTHEGYHLYTIPFRVDLADHEKTQIKFIDEKGIGVQRRYAVHLSSPAWLHAEQKHKVNQYIEFKGLSKALPQGTVRTYSSVEGSTVLLGINAIGHTPKKAKVSLQIGKDFDLLVKEVNLQRSETKKHYESTIRYRITNRSDTDKKVELLVPFRKISDLESIVKTDMKHEYRDGNTLKFLVDAKADSVEEFTVKYRNRR